MVLSRDQLSSSAFKFQSSQIIHPKKKRKRKEKKKQVNTIFKKCFLNKFKKKTVDLNRTNFISIN